MPVWLARRRKSSSPSLSDVYVQIDLVPAGPRASIRQNSSPNPHDLTLGGKPRLAQRRIYRLQPCVSVGPVHLGVELRVQRYRCAEVRQPEVRRVRLPVHRQVAQNALVLACRVQCSGNSLKDTQVRVRKLVFARQRSFARILHHPRPHAARGDDCSRRLGIGQLRLELHRPAHVYMVQPEVRDGKLQRKLTRLTAFERQLRPLAFDAVHLKAQGRRSARLRSIAAAGRRRVREVRLRRHIHIQPLQLHHRNPDRFARPITQRCMEPELVQLDQWPRRGRSAARSRNRHAQLPAPAARCAVPCLRPTAHSPAKHESCPAPRGRESVPPAFPRLRRAASAPPGATRQ